MAESSSGPGIGPDFRAAYQSAAVAEAWQRSAAARAGAMAAMTEQMLDLAGVGPGLRVLDVAAGTGEQTLRAAERVGPSGFVLAVDISAQMLDRAAVAARDAGLQQVETLVADAQTLSLPPHSFDAAICRSGLMLMRDPVAALRCIHRAVRPAAKLSALVFGPAERNPLQWLPTRIARKAAGLPPFPEGEPGMFALGADGVLEGALQAAGFHDLAVHRIQTRRQFASAGAAVASLRDALPSVHATLANLDPTAQHGVWAEIERALTELADADGLTVSGEMLIGVGTASSAAAR